MFDVGPLCWLLHITSGLWILFYGSKCLHDNLQREVEGKMQRDSVGPEKSDKNKEVDFAFLPFLLFLRSIGRRKREGESEREPTMPSRCLCMLCFTFCRQRHFNGRLNSHIAFNLCFSLHITPFGLLLGLTIYNETTRIQFWTILASQINYNKGERIVLGKNLLLSQGFYRNGRRSGEIFMHKINIFPFNSSVNFAEILLFLSFFCLSSLDLHPIHLGSEIGEEMAKGSKNMQHKL